jgi:uncharacterized Tic20 family protein
MAEKSTGRAVIVREEERGFAAAAHLLTAIPLWGLVFLAALWIYFKERSREVVFHIQQAMMFQAAILVALLVWVFASLVTLPINVLSPGLAELISRANLFLLASCYAVYVAVCLAGTVLTMLGRPFVYPVVGNRVLEGNLTKSRTEV